VAASLLLGSCRDGPHLSIEDLPVAGSMTATEAALTVFGADLAAVAPDMRVRVVPNDDASLAAVRSGESAAALVTRAPGLPLDGLTVADVAAQPLGAFVSFTFPIEEITAHQLRDIAAGRVRDWREVGGPVWPVQVAVQDATVAAAALAEPVTGTPAADISAALAERRGRVVFAAGSYAGPMAKPLRVDGLLPSDAGYPIHIQWVMVGPPDTARALALGRTLAKRAAAHSDPELTLAAVGDIMLGREVGKAIARHGARYPFEAAAPLLANADIRVANLELPLTERGRPAAKDYVFRAPPSVSDGLAQAGFTILNLANNHVLDYGVEGLLDTLATLDRAGIAHTGAGGTAVEAHTPAVLHVNGLRVAVLGYVNTPNDGRSGWVAESMRAGASTPGVAWGTPEAVRRDVTAARADADLVIVIIHAGSEYTATPNAVQRALAYAAVDAGAALVLGAHPHVLQGIEIYKRVPIVYSLGNFVFDLDNDDRRQPGLPSVLSAVLRVRLGRDGVRALEIRPAVIDQRDGRPLPVSGAAARPVYERVYSLTDALAAR
jgi:poly-gamma-glutamate capsule biosynthesis protein CapA/YwtB (metallophosphatase superfamily)